MRAGKLDRRITLQHRVVAEPDANGSAAPSYSDYATVWAEKLDAGGREFFAAGQVQAELATRFKIRHRADVVPTDRIVFEDASYNISHIQELGRREALMIFATTVNQA